MDGVVWGTGESLIILSTRGELGNKFPRKANIIIFARVVLNQVQKKMELTRQLDGNVGVVVEGWDDALE